MVFSFFLVSSKEFFTLWILDFFLCFSYGFLLYIHSIIFYLLLTNGLLFFYFFLSYFFLSLFLSMLLYKISIFMFSFGNNLFEFFLWVSFLFLAQDRYMNNEFFLHFLRSGSMRIWEVRKVEFLFLKKEWN